MTHSLRVTEGLYRYFSCVFHLVFHGLSQSFPKLCDPLRPTKTIWKPGFIPIRKETIRKEKSFKAFGFLVQLGILDSVCFFEKIGLKW